MGQEVSIDVGPISTKVSVLLPGPPQIPLCPLFLHLPSSNETVYFLKFPTEDLQRFREHPIYGLLSRKNTTLKGTGSHIGRKAAHLSALFDIQVEAVPATDLVLPALDRIMADHPSAFFTYSKVNWPLLPHGKAYKLPTKTPVAQKSTYPYILANLRSGLSVYRVDNANTARMISGSSLGGATFAGLVKLGTEYTTACQALDGAKHGDNSAVDVTVGDIYGCDYSAIGLKKDLIASSCGKLRTVKSYRDADFSRSVSMMLALNIAQIVYFAAAAEEVRTIIVAGSALEADPLMAMLQKATNCWADTPVSLVFCEYGLYLASLGGVLQTVPRE